MSMSLKELLALFSKETLATLYMVSISTLISYAIGIPLGVILVVTEEGSIAPNKIIHGILGFFTNIFRTIPFLILLVMVLPITKALVHTTLGPKAIIPPLVIASAPYIARMVESSLKEVDSGVIEAAKSMGSDSFQIIFKVLLPEARPSLYVGAAICYRYQTDMMLIAVVVLVVIVQLVQEFWMRLAKYSDKRGKLN